MKFLEIALGGAGLTTEELEAYKYSFRNFRAWTGPINLYRASFTEKTAKFWASDEMKRRIRKIDVRTLHIFGTNDDFLPLSAAKNSKKYVPDYQLRLLEGVSHSAHHLNYLDAGKLAEEYHIFTFLSHLSLQLTNRLRQDLLRYFSDQCRHYFRLRTIPPSYCQFCPTSGENFNRSHYLTFHKIEAFCIHLLS